MNNQDYITRVQSSLRGRYYSSSLGVFIIVSICIFILFLLEIIKFAKKIYTHNIPINEKKYLASKLSQKQQKNPPVVQTQMNINNKTQIDKSAIAARSIVSPSAAGGGIKTSQFSMMNRQETVQQLGKSVKAIKDKQPQPSQQRMVRFLYKVTQLIKNKLPLLAICLVNTALIASYQFLLASVCIGVVLFIVVEVMKKNSYENVAWIIELIAHAVVVSWFINLFTVGMPL